MKGDIPHAAFRLLTRPDVSVRTNERDLDEVEKRAPGNQGGDRVGGRQARPIIIKGKRYESMNDAKDTLHTSHASIKKLLDEGKARYA